MLKVRGFQVAPAELEGCILDHPDVADTCVVSVPDDYSGELPLAFVVLRSEAANRVRSDPKATEQIKQSIMKVRSPLPSTPDPRAERELTHCNPICVARRRQQGCVQEARRRRRIH